jgi:tRNA (guanine-N7-)-methyltransferase
MNNTVTPHHPYLHSFGRRKNRPLAAGKQNLMDTLYPALRVALPERGELSMEQMFPESRLRWLEIGFGGGEHMVHQAVLHPDIGIIGCEPFINGMASALRHIEERGCKNIRLWGDDARLLLEKLPDASLDKVFILYPDPWPKSRHHKRRLVSAATLEMLARVLKSGAVLQLASDHADYVVWMLEHLEACPEFFWTAQRASDWEQPPQDWIPTRYEQKTRKEGRSPTYLTYTRR